MGSRPTNQSCGSCYVWIDGPVSPGVAGYCCRWAPRAVQGSSDFPIKQAGEWCLEGVDRATLVPFMQPASGGGGAGAIGTLTSAVGLTTIVAQAAVTATSTVIITPTNVDATNLISTQRASIANSAGVGFTITWSGAALGTETFAYQVIG